MGLLMKWITCALSGGLSQRGGRMRGLCANQPEMFAQLVADALRLVAPLDHYFAHCLDGGRVGGIKEQHSRRRARIEFLLALLAQEIAHGDGNVAEIDVHRARLLALVAYRAMVGHIAEFVEVRDGNAAPRLFLVQERLDQQRCAEYLVARRIQQVGARHMRAAHRLALAAAQAILDRIGNFAQLALFQDQAFQFHQVEAGRVGMFQIAARQQFAFVETAFRVDTVLVGSELGDLLRLQKIELGDADAVLAGDHPAQIFRQVHDAVHRTIGLLQHGVVVRVDRNVGMHIAVARMHVQRDEHAAFQHGLMDGVALVEYGLVSAAAEYLAQRIAHFEFPRGAEGVVLQ